MSNTKKRKSTTSRSSPSRRSSTKNRSSSTRSSRGDVTRHDVRDTTRKPAEYIFVIFLLVATTLAFILTSFYSNGYESFSPLYLKCNDKVVSSAVTVSDNANVFEVKSAGWSDEEKYPEYTVAVYPNTQYDFVYEVDGAQYLFSKVGNITSAFDIKTDGNIFTISRGSVAGILQNLHPGKEITLPNGLSEYPFLLKINKSGTNEQLNVSFMLGFAFEIKLTPDHIIF